jgi:hypothetical protein
MDEVAKSIGLAGLMIALAIYFGLKALGRELRK